jgi:hypothetical protein
MCGLNLLMIIARSSVGIMHAMRKGDVARGMRGMGRVLKGLELGGGTEVAGGLGEEIEVKCEEKLSRAGLDIITKI